MKETPVQKRDWYVDRQIKAAQAAGVVPDVAGIEKMTGALLSELDRATAAGEITTKGKPAAPGPETTPEKEQLRAKALAESVGGEYYERDLPAMDPPVKKVERTGVDKERYVALCRRIALLCRRSTSRRLRYGIDGIEDADFEFPVHAKKIIAEWGAFNSRTGIYAFLSNRDAIRARDAQFALIADSSNGVVGHGWWVTR